MKKVINCTLHKHVRCVQWQSDDTIGSHRSSCQQGKEVMYNMHTCLELHHQGMKKRRRILWTELKRLLRS